MGTKNVDDSMGKSTVVLLQFLFKAVAVAALIH